MNFQKIITISLWLALILFFFYQKGYIFANFHSINADQAVEMLDDPNVTLLDVRTPEEYEKEHISGAILIPLSELDTRLKELDKNNKLLIYCQNGNRSVSASRTLSNKDYMVYNLTGGLSLWNNHSLLVRKP